MAICPVCDGTIEKATVENPALFCKYCGFKVWSVFSEDEPRFYGLLSATGVAMKFRMSAEELRAEVKKVLKENNL